MITGLQLALFGGVLFGAGVALLVWRLLPAGPDLGEGVRRRAPEKGGHTGRRGDFVDVSTADRLGRWVLRALPGSIWGKPLDQELALLRIPLVRFYGEKLLF